MGTEIRQHKERDESAPAGGFKVPPDLAIEHFGDESVIFLVEDERFVTVNRAAADLLEMVRDAFGDRAIDVTRLTDFLTANFALDSATAGEKAAAVITDWLACGILEEGT